MKVLQMGVYIHFNNHHRQATLRICLNKTQTAMYVGFLFSGDVL